MNNTGELIGNVQCKNVLECITEWTVDNFLNRPKDHLKCLSSPVFRITSKPEVEWQMYLYPHRYYINQFNKRINCIGLYMEAYSEKRSIRFKIEACEFSILTPDGIEVETKHLGRRNVVTGCDNNIGIANFIPWKVLLGRQLSLAPGGNLTVVCKIKTNFNQQVGSSDSTISRSLAQGYGPPNSRWSSKESLCSTTSDLPKKGKKAYTPKESKNAEVGRSDSALNTMKELLERGLCADVVLKCSGQSFKCHRNILATRSQVFEKMFHGDLKQTVIDLGEDITPGAMEDLLSFIYTGETKNLKDNSFLLFIVAGEYGLVKLKNMAEKEIIQKLTPDSAVDLLVFAQKTGAKELRKLAAECIAKSD